MDPLNANGDKILPLPRSMHLFAMSVLAIQVLVSLITYPFLPEKVPSHWNAAGQIDGYTSRGVHVLIYPAISIGIYLLFRLLSAAGPRLSRDDQHSTQKVMYLVICAILLFFLVIQLLVTGIALGMSLDVPFVLSLGIGVLFILIGNFLGKVRRNFWMGIRTPWTLANDTVWERTHRLGGWLLVATGLVGVVTSFIPPLRLWGMLGLLLLVVVVLTVYSYVVYHRIEVSGRESLSPPFDNEG